MFHFVSSIPPKDFLNLRKIKLLFSVRHYTLLAYPRLSALYDAGLYLEQKRIRGSFVECGVWKGGSAGVLASVCRDKGRQVWLLDSWEGLPEPTEEDISCTGKQGRKGMDLGSQETAKELLFKKLKLDPPNVHLVRGWFKETIPAVNDAIGEIALLHLDCDWYESVKCCLEHLYDRVVDGGFVFVDDYGHWRGCKRAVDEFSDRR